jgi:hypothetical protein
MLPGMAKPSSIPYISLLQSGAVSTETVLYLTIHACQALLHPSPCTSPFAVPVRPGHTRRSNSPACPRRRLPCGPAIRAHYTGPSMGSGVPLCPQFFVLASPRGSSGTLQLPWGWTDAGESDREGLSQVDYRRRPRRAALRRACYRSGCSSRRLPEGCYRKRRDKIAFENPIRYTLLHA